MIPRRCFCGHREDEHYKTGPGINLCRRCEKCDGFATLDEKAKENDAEEKMTTQSREEAIELLENTSSRMDLARRAFGVAAELALERGDITAQDVWKELLERNLLTEEEQSFRANWLSLVFIAKEHKKFWQQVGFRSREGNTKRNVHTAPRMVWRLTDEAKAYVMGEAESL